MPIFDTVKLLTVAVGLTLATCKPQQRKQDLHALEKIEFDLSQIDEQGLIGPDDGKVIVDYEFCVPEGEKYADEVMAIDPTLQAPLSNGRINCGEGYMLFIGNTHQKNWEEVLMKLARLEYVEEIRRVMWE